MLNQNRPLWIGLIVVISLGLLIEVLKSTRSSQDGSSWRPRIFGMLEEDDSGEGLEHRSVKANRARSRLLKGRVAGLADTSAFKQTTVAAAVVPGPPIPNLTPLAPKKLTDAEKKKLAEAEKKKKKKKKKKDGETQEVASAPQSPPSGSDDKKSNTSDISGGSSMYGGSGHRMTILGAVETENPETLEQWLAYILREPSYERTLKLIKAHEIHTVDSEIFHEVITQMLADARGKMHEYAIYALGSSPSLKSFILLVTANVNEPLGSPLKIMSRTNILNYAKLENLRYLANVISSGEEATSSFEAMRLIQMAATDYKPKASPPSSGPTTSSTTASRQFSSLVPVLVRVWELSADATLRDEAKRTLTIVQNIVGSTTPVASLRAQEAR